MPQPTTLLEAMRIIAEHTGKSLTLERDWLRDQVNQIRRAVWKQEALRLAWFNQPGCVCVECYYDDCQRCCGKYTGITLPQNVTGIHLLTANGIVIQMRGHNLFNGGCCASSCGCLKAEMMVRRFPLQKPIPANYKGRLMFRAKEAKDKGQPAGIEYVSRRGVIIREDIKLSIDGAMTTESPADVLKVTFPRRCGWVDVLTEDAWSLGAYHPAIISPSHLRLKLSGVRAGDLVRWEAVVEPHDVFFDTDQVEWSNPLDWKNHYQILDLHFKTSKTPGERYAYETSLQMAAASADSELASQQTLPAASMRPTGLQNLRNKIRRLQSSPFPYGPWRQRYPRI